MEGADSAPAPKKRIRKPRGRGLRTKTGCLTCRKRHKKCDEKQPVCGPCGIADRECVYPPNVGVQRNGHRDPRDSTSQQPPGPSRSPSLSPSPLDPEPHPDTHQSVTGRSPLATFAQAAAGTVPSPGFPMTHPSPVGLSLGDGFNFGYSPDTVSSELWSADFASTRWLSLLATDAANADSGFSLHPSPAPPDPDDAEGRPAKAKRPGPPRHYTATGDPERRTWQLERDMTLTNHEAILFRHFTEHVARWLDLLDASTPFAARATRLALRNVGVMKAILALAAKHMITTEASRGGNMQSLLAPAEHGGTDESMQYYYETLHYVQEALAYNSYTYSEELLVTVIAISSYEMLDESDGRGNWQRHLKGVFWIQRSQNTDGECGGLRQAIWWSWLRQDIWAAFREKRRCLSIWKPTLSVRELDQDQLARRTLYLLALAVNYCAQSRAIEIPEAAITDPSASEQRARAREDLLRKMEDLRSLWGERFRPLPAAARGPADVFSPLWIHPPHFGIAVQAYSFAQILITLHSPIPPGFNGYLKAQRTLSEAVDTICGVAMELSDPGAQIFSAQCLYGAGLCVQEPVKRERIVAMMEDCEARVGWAPMANWRHDLRQEWAKADSEHRV
ncbi:hypothetical protein F5X68DRAFT_163536 [Plectosphaerella plurivora]|uniref:Zn(2)-C6 fungal-type domain-containing protein n=1 Tax=Plectosphaerella plurivora TaxID=936078 RepID=A0A9P8VKN1_9PEZI|nr:hypothetical protein F5X68DRAFT_163536 [Plectosphaerella plurivora]